MKSVVVKGTLSLTGRGFGFVNPQEGPDVLIPYDHLRTAGSGDTVEVELFPDSAREKPAGRILRVLDRNTAPLIGRVRIRGKELRVYPEDRRFARALVVSPSAETARLRDGDVVRAGFRSWDDPRSHPRGEVLELIARADEPGLERTLITLTRGFEGAFPPEVEKAAAALTMPPARKMLKNRRRRDLRKHVCFTIDPETARDFDDAVSIIRRDDGMFELGVHIADVSFFVEEGGVIDKEAWKRATSVYLGAEVIPMLPEHLSNGLCSLVPGEDRAAFTVLAVVDSTGTVHNVEITESLIRSNRRFTYQEAEKILDGAADPLAAELHLLHLLTQVLGARRREEGSVDMDLPATHIQLDKEGLPVSIRPVERLKANRLVEECMLLANRLVAERGGKPFVYRIHEQPRTPDVRQLLDLLEKLGIRYQLDGDVRPEDYRNILRMIENLEFKDLVERLALKSLTKAVYSIENVGHFGLAFDAYTHFTSPIRRYPDLVVHRLLKGATTGGKKQKDYLQKTCDHSSRREREATEAEREYTRIKALQYLKERLGREYDGVVSGVTSFGLFVEISRYLVEGLVHISTLGDERWEFEKDSHRIVGSSSGTTFTLGDPVRVRVKAVSPEEQKADLILIRE